MAGVAAPPACARVTSRARRQNLANKNSRFPNCDRLGSRAFEIRLVDLRGHHEIALCQPANLVRVNLDVHLAPGQAQIRMMTFGFGHRAYAIYEIEPRFEIGKRKALRDVMLFD